VLLVGQQEGHTACKIWVVCCAGVVICADLHTAQLMPLPLTVCCSSRIQMGFTFLVAAHPGNPGQSAAKRVCVFVVWYYMTVLLCWLSASHASFAPRSALASRWASPAYHSAPTTNGLFWLAARAAGFSAVRQKPEDHMQEVNRPLVFYYVVSALVYLKLITSNYLPSVCIYHLIFVCYMFFYFT